MMGVRDVNEHVDVPVYRLQCLLGVVVCVVVLCWLVVCVFCSCVCVCLFLCVLFLCLLSIHRFDWCDLVHLWWTVIHCHLLAFTHPGGDGERLVSELAEAATRGGGEDQTNMKMKDMSHIPHPTSHIPHHVLMYPHVSRYHLLLSCQSIPRHSASMHHVHDTRDCTSGLLIRPTCPWTRPPSPFPCLSASRIPSSALPCACHMLVVRCWCACALMC